MANAILNFHFDFPHPSLTVQTLPKKKHHFHIYCHKSETYKSSFCEVFGRAYLTNDVNVLHHLLPRQRSLSFRKKALIKGAEKEATPSTVPSTQYTWICKLSSYVTNYNFKIFNQSVSMKMDKLPKRVEGKRVGWAVGQGSVFIPTIDSGLALFTTLRMQFF